VRLKSMALSAVTFALLAGSTALTTSVAVATEKDETAKLNTEAQAGGERSSFVDDWDPAVSIDNAPEAKTKSAAQETTNRAPAFHSWDQAAVIENTGDNKAETENVALARKGAVAQSVDDWDPAAAINDQNHDNDEPAKKTTAVTHVIDDQQVAVDLSKDNIDPNRDEIILGFFHICSFVIPKRDKKETRLIIMGLILIHQDDLPFPGVQLMDHLVGHHRSPGACPQNQ